jgi:hypothetical protein
MNGNSALLDSNIIIYLSKKELPFTFFDKFDELHISVISYMEVLGFKFRSNEEEDFVKELIELFEVQFIDQNVAEKVIEIRKQNRMSPAREIREGNACNGSISCQLQGLSCNRR